MAKGDEPRLLEFRVPVSEDYWREYGIPLGLLLAALVVVAVLVARRPGDGLLVGVAFLGLSVGAMLAGLVAYNVAVAALIAAKR
jgi:hypothetical protein